MGQRLGQSEDDGRQEFYRVGEQLFRLSVVSSLIKYTQVDYVFDFLSVLAREYFVHIEELSLTVKGCTF